MDVTSHIPEILAPAGGRAQFFAALNAGADAVYLGLKSFNARSRAENFTEEDLRELVPLAHDGGMKVLVTVNVLIKDAELPELIQTLAALEDAGVDAIIVQDLAVARIARASFPGLRLHASTQMAIHNLAGVEAARELGFRRVVLARELTAQEIRRIRAKVPRSEVELEVFCHGSLCYSYSGLCFFSGAEDSRSGNRGECAYTCRQPYKLLNEPGHGFLFSMKDLDTSKSLDLLVGAGVDTLKIEGRKKDAQYVASTVRLYREALDRLQGAAGDRPGPKPEDDLKFSFQRKTTSLFVRGRYHENVIDLDNPTHAGVRVGRVESVQPGRITLKTGCALERFDGLRVSTGDRAYEDLRDRYERKNAELSLRDFKADGARAFTASPGQTVEIEWPHDAALPEVGDFVDKIRSADLKRRVEQLATPPAGARLRPWRTLDRVDVEGIPSDDGRLCLIARAHRHEAVIAEASLWVDAARARGPSALANDLEDALATFGDAGFRAAEVRYAGDSGWFVPRSRLKALKQELGGKLEAGALALREQRTLAALERFARPLEAAQRVPDRYHSFAVKTDRIETLEDVAAYAAEHPAFALRELVFEPKRAFLPELAPAALGERLAAIEAASGLKIRLAVPTVMRAWDEPLLQRWLQAAAGRGIARYEVGNLGGALLLKSWGLPTTDVDGDFTLYALSSAATGFWHEHGINVATLSVEDDLANLRSHLGRLDAAARARVQAILFKDTPLFIAEACSLTALHDGCPTSKVCGYRTLEIENAKGERFYVAHESCKSIVYGKEAYAVSQARSELAALGVRRFRVDFLTRAYDRTAAFAVLDAVREGRAVAGTHSANFARKLL